jgi:hypothetical protein
MQINANSTAGADLLAKQIQPMQKFTGEAVAILAALGTVAEFAVGEYTGTGAALDIALPFDPKVVIVNNLTDGDTMGFAFNTTNVGTKSQVIALAVAQEAAQGILFGAAGTKKFSLGTAATLNETAKVFQYLAIG